MRYFFILIVVIVSSEIVESDLENIWNIGIVFCLRGFIKRKILSGWEIRLILRLEKVKLKMRMLVMVCKVGVFYMVIRIKVLLIVFVKIRGIFKLVFISVKIFVVFIWWFKC